MPQYEYRCSACAREFEYTQRMSDPELTRCEACGADKLERLISWTSVRSGGWKGALSSANQREALKGTHAIDGNSEQRFRGNAPAAVAAATEPAPAVAPEAATAAAKPSAE